MPGGRHGLQNRRLGTLCRGVGSIPTLSANIARSARSLAGRVVLRFGATCPARRDRHRFLSFSPPTSLAPLACWRVGWFSGLLRGALHGATGTDSHPRRFVVGGSGRSPIAATGPARRDRAPIPPSRRSVVGGSAPSPIAATGPARRERHRFPPSLRHGIFANVFACRPPSISPLPC